MDDWKCINGAKLQVENGIYSLEAIPQKDYYIDPESGAASADAAFAYVEVEGDFVARVRLWHDFESVYDAAVLFAHISEDRWLKTCFEKTAQGSKAVVTTAANGFADDAAGAEVEQDFVWLQIARRSDAFSAHYSFDGENYIWARICRLPAQSKIKVGLLAQSPLGKGGKRFFSDFSLQQKTVDLRKGV